MATRRAPASAPDRRAHWQDVVAASKATNLSIREFCRQRGIHPSYFYYWRRRLVTEPTAPVNRAAQGRQETRFALVQAEPATAASPATRDGSLELILESGWRLHIRPGVDAATLRTVLSALVPEA